MKMTSRTQVGALLTHPEGHALMAEYLPRALDSSFVQAGQVPIGMVARMEPDLAGDEARKQEFLAKVATLDLPDRVREEPVVVSESYEANAEPASASWRVTTAQPSAWKPVEVELSGPTHGNPFVDVELTATVAGRGDPFEVTGFYDGDGRYVLRFLPDAEGAWSFTTASNARSLAGISGSVEVGPAKAGAHGPVRTNGFGFRHADGTRHVSLGTTSYVWTHQTPELEEATLATLAEAPFTKMRMCVFPKSYLFNSNEPPTHAFERNEDGTWDTKRFVPEFFRHFETRVAQLDELGIQADVIVFHPYDRWGYSDLDPVVDDRYLRYLTARLSAMPNVWWSLANEFDLMGTKSIEDWDRFASVIRANDPVRHLMGIHNCIEFFDHTRDWVTHASVQRVDVYRTAENTDAWRREWGKPVVIDECAYEGNIDMGWGNITGEEMTRRFWEASIRGGWCGHGETYWASDDVLWWSKGGVLKGTSPARIAFLRTVLEEAPGDLDPVLTDWDAPSATVGDAYKLVYFSFMQPLYRTFVLPTGTRWRAEVLDTWNMTVTTLAEPIEGSAKVDLPGRPYIAVRLTRVD